ncbi:hypothetical protein HBH96_025830 [Parastagonospora nodorum]|nr:hypothetical protein HBH42_090740 [Parastagonospora nodorum]KAH5068452.1 hypothetical protein HBH96_025830 [Parastagonospora nodorum]
MTAIETKCGTRAAGKLGQRGRQKVSDQGILALSNWRRLFIGLVLYRLWRFAYRLSECS